MKIVITLILTSFLIVSCGSKKSSGNGNGELSSGPGADSGADSGSDTDSGILPILEIK